LVRQLLDLGLECPDLGDDPFQRLDLPAFAEVEDLVENSHRELSLSTAPESAASPRDETVGSRPVTSMHRCSPPGRSPSSPRSPPPRIRRCGGAWSPGGTPGGRGRRSGRSWPWCWSATSSGGGRRPART